MLFKWEFYIQFAQYFQEGNPDLKQDLPVYVEFMQFHTKLEL